MKAQHDQTGGKESHTRRLSKGVAMVALLPIAGIISAILYLIVRTMLFFVADYFWYEKIAALFLLAAEFFMLVHGVGYLMEILHVALRKGLVPARTETPDMKGEAPAVAVIVASYHEPLNVLEDTMVSLYNLSYKNKRVYFLDDTRYDLPGKDPAAMAAYRKDIEEMCLRMGAGLFRRRWRGAKAGIVNDFLAFHKGENREGFEFRDFGGSRPGEEEYLAVFDADQNPLPGFLEPLAARMKAEPRLAFIQTPQYYTNFEKNRVARAASVQQSVFYEYICEGKSLKDAMFCCGTNVLFRIAALNDVDGFDESSVTEDFATSLKFHMSGWRSEYSGTACAFGMGPEDLGAYFKQQFRWALGTTGMFRRILCNFIRSPSAMSPVMWWEYLLSGTYYFVGYVYLIMMLGPALYLLFSIPTFMARPEVYIVFFLPYLAITLSVFLWTLQLRGYSLGDMALGQLIAFASFPVHCKAALLGILGVKGRFVVTPKGGSVALPLRDLKMQLAMVLLNFTAIVWGANRLYYEGNPAWAIGVNMFWSLYHCLLLSSVFYFNSPEETMQDVTARE